MTLLEILIAMLLGAFLLAGVLQIFLSSKQAYRLQDNLARLQENGRFAIEFINRDIRMAGYRACLSSNIPTPVGGSDNTGLNGSDAISIQMSDSACPAVLTNISYTINNGVSGQPALFRNDGVNNQELIEHIEDMQLLYGEDINGDNTPDYYVPAGTAGLNMNQVVSIRVSLLVASRDDNLASQPVAYLFNGATTTPGDRKLRRVFSSTIALRNRLP